ncbi:hypothetical protein [Phyllobacterium sp. SB3]|uniref:hypothetical protein n=1 Tax=Phyllobacterium sp. SB3 TaxID=3156073 RepID=UPI0032AFA430
MGLRILQIVIFVSFLVANIYFGWGVKGIAAPVMAGILAYGVTLVLLAIQNRRLPKADRAESIGSGWREDMERRISEKKDHLP